MTEETLTAGNWYFPLNPRYGRFPLLYAGPKFDCKGRQYLAFHPIDAGRVVGLIAIAPQNLVWLESLQWEDLEWT